MAFNKKAINFEMVCNNTMLAKQNLHSKYYCYFQNRKNVHLLESHYQNLFQESLAIFTPFFLSYQNNFLKFILVIIILLQ